MPEHPHRAAIPLSTNHGASQRRLGVRNPGPASARIPRMSSDPAAGIGVLTALAAGTISFLSPCVLPLVPGYLSAVTGLSATDLEKADWRRGIGPGPLVAPRLSAC